MKSSTLPHPPAIPASAVARLRRKGRRLLAWIDLTVQIQAERRQLSGLTDEQLADIGINRAQRDLEARRELGDIPVNRLRRSRKSD